MRIHDTDVMVAARDRGLRGRDLKDRSAVKYAILERNGAISVIEVDDESDEDEN